MRDDQFLTTVKVQYPNGQTEDLGIFDSFQGGEGDSEETMYKPGGSAQKPLGGRQSRGAFTVGRLYERARDFGPFRRVDAARGKASVVVKRQPLDDDENPYGSPITYRGKVKTVTAPDSDSNSGSNPALWTIACTPEGDLA